MATRSSWIIDKTEAVSSGGMVAAMQPLAAEAGAEMLRRGGNAIDAAVATAFAIGVVEPFMSGVGGIAFMTYRDAASGEIVCFDGSTVLPAAIRPELFEILPGNRRAGMYGWKATKDDANNTGWLSPGVPGTPSLLGEAHRRFGKLPWHDLLQPAIRLAADGYSVNYYVSMMLARGYELVSRFPESRRTFIRPNGAPYPAAGEGLGTPLVQTDLARTLRLIAEEGPEVVYRGEIGRLIAEDMRRNGGLITEADLAAHRTRVFDPTVSDYRGYQIAGQLPSSGYPTVVEALKILEGFDLAGLGFQSVEATHLISEALRRAMVDRLYHLGDPELTPTPLQGVISEGYAVQRRKTIDPNRATPDEPHGDPWPFDPRRAEVQPERAGVPGEGLTTHITVIDSERNMVALTSTLGGAFGSGVVIEGTGILLNNATTWFDPEPGAVTSIGPGKRVMSASTPVVLLHEGKPFAALGSPGGRRVMSAIYQIIVNLIDFKLGMQAAVSAPRVHTEGPKTEISMRFPAEVIEALESMGHQIVTHEDGLAQMPFARPNGILIDPDSGDLHAGVFQFTPATAIGV
ncbi:MAG TPA: gamma-glutamyltransferase [Thermomicrobiaceae bacterium]|nr:gamma-glutamyltransferase [Thermomicrobiaceae bacterium]